MQVMQHQAVRSVQCVSVSITGDRIQLLVKLAVSMSVTATFTHSAQPAQDSLTTS